MPTVQRDKLLGLLKPVDMPLRTPIFSKGKPPRYVHLVTSGLASTVNDTAVDFGVEVSIATRDGFPEALHLLGPLQGDTTCFMQLAGTALRMDFSRFQQEFHTSEILRSLVLCYVQEQFLVTAQLAVCNTLHSADQRLARWLLMVADRIGEPTINLTQEFLAGMVGSQRSTVTLAAGALQRKGLIEYRRGVIRISDRGGLEKAACECYGVTQRLNAQLYR